jgi:hypothetical protein
VRDGVFTRFELPRPHPVVATASFVELQPAGPPREIHPSRTSHPVAEQPEDADFAQAAIWRIALPPDLDLSADPVLRLHYVGDVARLTLDGRLLTDDFYNGNVWEIGLRRHAPGILKGDLRIVILPLRKDAVTGPARKIYLADGQIPDFGDAASIVQLKAVDIVPRYEARLSARGTR